MDLLMYLNIFRMNCIKSVYISDDFIYKTLCNVYENEILLYQSSKMNRIITILGEFPSSLLGYTTINNNLNIDIIISIPVWNVPDIKIWDDLDKWIRKCSSYDRNPLYGNENDVTIEQTYSNKIVGGIHLFTKSIADNIFKSKHQLIISKIYIPIFQWADKELKVNSHLLEAYIRLYLITNCEHGFDACYLHSFDKTKRIANIFTHGSPDDHARKSINIFKEKFRDYNFCYCIDCSPKKMKIHLNLSSYIDHRKLINEFNKDKQYYIFSKEYLKKREKTVQSLVSLASYKCVPQKLNTSKLH